MKRLLSIILAISMILALIPAAFATDTATEGFTVSLKKVTENGDETYNPLEGYKRIGPGLGYSDSNGTTWRIGASADSGYSVPVFDPDSESTEAIGIPFTCPAAGTYIPTLTWSDSDNCANVEVHITENTDDFSLSEFVKKAGSGTRVGTVDLFVGETATLSEVELSAGNYFFVMIANGENGERVNWQSTSSGNYFATQTFKSIDFAPVTDEALTVGDDVTYNFSTDALNLSTESATGTTVPANHLGYIGQYNKTTIPDGSTTEVTNSKWPQAWTTRSGTTADTGKARIDLASNLLLSDSSGFVGYGYINEENSNPWMLSYANVSANLYVQSTSVEGKSHLWWNAYKEKHIYNGLKNYLTFKISVPSKGKYNVCIDSYTKDESSQYSDTTQPADTEIYISATETLTEDAKINDYEFYNPTTSSIGIFEAETAGDYYFTIKMVDSSEAVTAANADITEAYKDNEDEEKRYTTWADYCTGENKTACYGVHLKSLTLEYAGETTADAAVTAQKEAQQNPVINAAVADATEKEASTTNTVSLLKAFIGDDEKNTTLTNKATETDGIYTVTADDAPTGYSFLYWTKGLEYDSKRIVSIDKTISFKPEIGGNYLIAVYGKTGDETETKKFINGNGQLITDATDENHTPSMPGYGAFKGWVDCGNGVYMAEYEGRESYTVTVKNDGTKVETRTPEYGSAVTVTAPARASDGYRLFAYWQKDGEIVSLDRKYTFYAFEDCTVNAVYNEYEPVATSLRKIILTNMGSNNYMAEFIGFGDAVEKGIAVGSKKIAMTTDKTQFTINADETGTVRGYAIDSEGNVYYSK